MAERQEWHADKRVPIALILTIAIQTAGGVWWAATVTEQIKNVAAVQQEDRARINANLTAISTLNRSEAAMDQRLVSIEASQRRIESSVTEILQYLRSDRQ